MDSKQSRYFIMRSFIICEAIFKISMRRYFSIEFLRFLTSLSVLLYHYRHFYFPLNILSSDDYEIYKNELPFFNYIDWLYTYGFYGVHVFYTISGFVFAHVYLSLSKNTSFKEFSINRISRYYIFWYS